MQQQEESKLMSVSLGKMGGRKFTCEVRHSPETYSGIQFRAIDEHDLFFEVELSKDGESHKGYMAELDDNFMCVFVCQANSNEQRI